MAPLVGRFSDRRGRMLPVRIGLATTIPLLLAFSLPDAVAPLALLIVALGGSLGAFWAPSMAMLSDAAEAQRLDQALAAALINLAWAGGQIIGSTGGGGLAKASGDAVPMAIVAALCAITLIGVGWGGRRGQRRYA